jgi:hypothetical protein
LRCGGGVFQDIGLIERGSHGASPSRYRQHSSVRCNGRTKASVFLTRGQKNLAYRESYTPAMSRSDKEAVKSVQSRPRSAGMPTLPRYGSMAQQRMQLACGGYGSMFFQNFGVIEHAWHTESPSQSHPYLKARDNDLT